LLAPIGYEAVATPGDADLMILNTCHIREKAAEKVFSDLGRLRGLQHRKSAAGGRMIVAVAGCVAQAEGEEIRRRADNVDIVVGPQSYHRLPELIARASRAAGVALATDFPVDSKFDHLPEDRAVSGPAAFLTVQEGCDKFCTFCVVPYTRGAEYSRPPDDVVREAIRLAAKGVREITVLGQNVNAYHGRDAKGDDVSLGQLLERLAEVPGVDRLRYTTSHPLDMHEALYRAHRDVPAVMPFVHLPVQSGSDRVLAAMNRRHTIDDYRRVVDRLRAARPDVALSSDFIVGYPGETDRDFAATIALVREIGFAQSFSFKYSMRPGTPAAAAEQTAEPLKAARLQELQALLDRQSQAFNRAMVGRRLGVLLEKPGRHAGQLVGRSPYLQAVHLEAPAASLGSIVEVEIVAAGPNSLEGRPTIAANDAIAPRVGAA
jgi:tRNA-2-methylthio-N6-dimethylallyladenosine synthase